MKTEKQIFITYSWQDTAIVDELENELLSVGINLTRDIREISYKESIYNFMKKIRSSDFVIMIISDAYLKSLNCMNEVIEFIKDDDFKDRILQILPYTDSKKADIYNPKGILKYVEYWQQECIDFKQKIEKIDDINKGSLIKDLKKYLSISSSISEFLSEIADILSIPYDKLKKTHYKVLVEKIGFENQNLINELFSINKLDSNEDKEIRIDSLVYSYPNNSIVYLYKGIFCYKNGQNKKAISNLQKCIELSPNNPIPYTYIGGAYDELKDYKKALPYYKQSLKLNPRWNLTYLWQGMTLDKSGKYKEALESYNTAINMTPISISEFGQENDYGIYKALGIENAELLYNRAMAYDSINEYELAILDYNKAIEINPNDGDYYYNRGLAFFNLKNYNSAISDYNKAIEINSKDGFYYCGRGLYYYMLKDYQKAEADWLASIKHSPEESLAYTNLMELYVITNQMELASELIEKFNDSNPTHEEELLYLFMVNLILIILKKDNDDFKHKFFDSLAAIKTFELFHVELDNFIDNVSDIELKSKLLELTNFLKSKQITPLPNKL